MKLLHIDSSILDGNSVSRTLSASTVARLKASDPKLELTYRDLAAHPVPHLSGAFLAAMRGSDGEHVPALQRDLVLSAKVLEEFLAADVVVIGVAFYNFTIPSQLKAWIDRILIAGRTFRYTADGQVEGLAGAKRVVLAIARGGFYGPGTPTESFEHAESYLRVALGFIGVTHIEVVAAEGTAISPEQRGASVANAERRIAVLAA